MKRYWDDTTIYEQPSVEELRRKAEASLQSGNRKGRKFEPVIPTAKGGMCASWWGEAWCRNLEQYADYASRLERGKRYIKSGAVIDLKVKNGKIEAKVQGRRKTPYNVEIQIGRLSEENCQKIINCCTERIENMESLISGNFPETLKTLFTGQEGLFPSPREISFRCSCPDWALMCKHGAAVMYGIGVRFDENPFYFFQLRGIDAERFIDVALENKVEKMLENADCQSDRIMEDEKARELFGVL